MILKSAKENTAAQVQTHPQASSAIKKSQVTANGSQPLQTSQWATNVNTTALLTRIAAPDSQFLYSIFYYNYMAYICLVLID